MERIKQIAAESITIGHPDVVADCIADAVVQAFYEQDTDSHVACEVMVTEDFCLVAGEVKSKADIDVESIVRAKINEIGYNDPKLGFCGDTVEIINKLHEQSADIDMGVSRDTEEAQGAGDQGFMIGYANNETSTLMPLPIALAKSLTDKLTEVRRTGEIQNIYPDGKSQVVILYKESESDLDPEVVKEIVEQEFVGVETVLISVHHAEDIDLASLKEEVIEKVIKPVFDSYNLELSEEVKILFNPTGLFTIGGPKGDTGLTGRKLAVQNYGPASAIGGGATHGKCLTKTDRSGAYAARYVAKNIVGAGLASECTVQVSYAIGVAEPTSVNINTNGTSIYPEGDIEEAVKTIFDLTPYAIKKWIVEAGINFNEVCEKTAFGNSEFPWEVLDKTEPLLKYFEN